jgi:hypothetical protein
MTIPAHIQTWIDALRSGKYQQCQNQLTDGEGFCCLGVYAELHGIEIPVPNYSPEGDDEEDGNGATYSELTHRIDNPIVRSRGVEMNDRGHSFSEIADMIEREYSDA